MCSSRAGEFNFEQIGERMGLASEFICAYPETTGLEDHLPDHQETEIRISQAPSKNSYWIPSLQLSQGCEPLNRLPPVW